MSKAKPKRSGRQSSPACKASKPTGSATTSGKSRRSSALDIKADKATGGPGKPTVSRATKAKRTASKPTVKARASVTAEAKPRAAAQSTPRQERRQFELPTPPAPQREKLAIEVKAEPFPPQDLQSQRPLEVAVGRERTDVDDNSQPEPPTVAQPPATTRRSPMLGVMRTNVEIQQVMTRSAVATVRFAASLARCRSPMDLWAAQLRFVSDFLQPGGPRK